MSGASHSSAESMRLDVSHANGDVNQCVVHPRRQCWERVRQTLRCLQDAVVRFMSIGARASTQDSENVKTSARPVGKFRNRLDLANARRTRLSLQGHLARRKDDFDQEEDSLIWPKSTVAK